MLQFWFIGLWFVFIWLFLAFSIKALKSFRTGHSRNVLEVLIGYTRLLPFGENLNAIFFKAQKDEQKPESFCLFNSSANRGDGKSLTCHCAYSHF